MLIGNLTRDPELRYTPAGTAVCTIGLATNRYWTTEAGEKKEEVEFHRVVSWNKLAELCSQLLTKGRKIYVEGRLRTNSWQTADGAQRTTTEVVIEDMILLDSKRPIGVGEEGVAEATVTTPQESSTAKVPQQQASIADSTGSTKKKATDDAGSSQVTPTEEVNPDDIPF